MMGIKLNQSLGKILFWIMFIFFNSTFLPLFAIGMAGQPRRVFEYARSLQTLNDWGSISAFFLGGAVPIFLLKFLFSTGIAPLRGGGDPGASPGPGGGGAPPPPPPPHCPVAPGAPPPRVV